MIFDVIFIGLLGGAFLIWVMYRGFVTRDLHEHWDEVRTAAFFLGVAGLTYWWLLG
jgi:hypothetical protein